MLGSFKSALGFETLPLGAGDKTFYDLKADLPGKNKEIDFVSREWRQRSGRIGRLVYCGPWWMIEYRRTKRNMSEAGVVGCL
jgi:hypothetical protein